jgi:hypothetical protein
MTFIGTTRGLPTAALPLAGTVVGGADGRAAAQTAGRRSTPQAAGSQTALVAVRASVGGVVGGHPMPAVAADGVDLAPSPTAATSFAEAPADACGAEEGAV